MNRWKAAVTHLGISALIATSIVTLMLFVWYPGPFFRAMGGNELAALIVAVDMVVGPFITLIICNPGKPMRLLRLDFAVIATVQLAALAYGVYVVSEARPVYMVFTVDRFDLVAADDLRESELSKVTDPAFKGRPWGKPRTVAVRTPSDPREQFRILQSALAGADLQTFPQHFVALSAMAGEVRRASKPMEVLRKKHPDSAKLIEDTLSSLGRRAENTRYLPLKARARDFTVLVAADSAEVVGYLDLNPW